jgi:hypothetical protein
MNIPDPSSASATPPPARRMWWILPLLVVAGMLGALSFVVARGTPRVSEETIRSVIAGALQEEARQAFLITGSLDLTVTTRVRNIRTLQTVFGAIPLGTAESTVRAPGRVSYGVEVGQIRPRDILVSGDTIEIVVPDPRVYSVEPLLEQMEVETEAGWFRLRGDAREEVQQQAIALVTSALKQQALEHLADNEQPRINTAETLAELLGRAFASLGEQFVFRFKITDRLQLTT